MEAAKEAQFAANIGVGGDLSNLLSEDNPDGVVMITEDGKITFVNKVLPSLQLLLQLQCRLSQDCCCCTGAFLAAASDTASARSAQHCVL